MEPISAWGITLIPFMIPDNSEREAWILLKTNFFIESPNNSNYARGSSAVVIYNREIAERVYEDICQSCLDRDAEWTVVKEILQL